MEIRLPAPHPRLRPRVQGELRRPGHPGTAVQIGEDLYEVVAAERTDGEWVYRLEPWSEAETIRVCVEWGEAPEREFVAALRRDQARERKSFWTWAGQALLGFLPAWRQERRCQEAGLDPARATLWSAVLETVVGLPFAFFFFVSLIAGRAGGAAGSIPAWLGLLAVVVTAEGALRLAAVVSTGEPLGSLFLTVLDLRLRSDRARLVPGDEISRFEGELKVLSPVPKAWWERAGGVTVDGEPYRLAGADREKEKYAYRFVRGGGRFPVLDPELERVRNRSSDLSYVFAPIWGFLPAERQRTLETYGRYRARPYVLISVGINILVALALAGPGLRNASGGVFEAWSLIKLAAAALLFAESLLRLLRLVKYGRTSGSVLGFVVLPFYDWAIKDRPAPRA